MKAGFVRGASRQLAEESCEFCNKGEHDLCDYLLDLENLNQGASDHREYTVHPVTNRTCLCYRSWPEQHLDYWSDDF